MKGTPLRVTVLVENEVLAGPAGEGTAALRGEHGLAFFVESEEGCGLLDTGQTDAVVENAAALGVSLRSVSWIVLSHGHFDHTGGLEEVLRLAPEAHVYAHPCAFEGKYSYPDAETWRLIGAPVTKEALEGLGAGLRLSRQPVQVSAHIQTTGEVPKVVPFERPSSRFFADRDGVRVPDLLPDDQSLIVRTVRGVVVLLGCAHSGVINTLHQAAALTGERRFHAVMGGTHLLEASEERIQRTIEGFRAFEVERIGLAHCTGSVAVEAFEQAFGERCFACSAGTVVTFD